MNYQYGSFEVKSVAMRTVLENLETQTGKSFFVVVGDLGSGKTTMLTYLNKKFFKNTQKNIFDDFENGDIGDLESALISTSKDHLSQVLAKLEAEKTCIIELPCLSSRRADIVDFSTFFLDVLSLMNNERNFKLTDKGLEKLLHYEWPNNFHELESVLENAFNKARKFKEKSLIEPEHIELGLVNKSVELVIGHKLDEVERKYILQTLYFVHQNRTRAAEILGISIRTLRNKINQYREEGYL